MWQVQKAEGRGRKGGGIFPSLSTPSLFFTLVKIHHSIWCMTHVEKFSKQKCLQPSLRCYKLCQKYKMQQTSQIPFQRCHCQDISFKWTCNWMSSKVRTTFLVSVVVQIYFCLNLLFFVFGILVNDNEFETKNKLIKPRIKLNDNWLCGVKE